MTRLELTDEERAAPLQLLDEELRHPKFPLSRETEACAQTAEKLKDAGKPKSTRRSCPD